MIEGSADERARTLTIRAGCTGEGADYKSTLQLCYPPHRFTKVSY